MNRPSVFIPVSNRDMTSLLVPTLKVKSLEQLVSSYMQTGDTSGLQSAASDSYDFEDDTHIDFDSELPQNMGKIDAILHFRNIRDSLRSPLQYKTEDSKNNVSEITNVSSETNNNNSNGNPEQGA